MDNIKGTTSEMITCKLVDNIESDNIENDEVSFATNVIDESGFLIDMSDKKKFSEVLFDKTLFRVGVEKVSEICGMVYALSNVGVSPTEAYRIIVNKELTEKTMLAEEKTIKEQLDSNLKIAALQYPR